MKAAVICLLISVGSTSLAAQKSQGVVKKGSVLEYTVIPGGMPLKSFLTLEKLSPDTVTFEWKIPATASREERSGRRSMLRASIDVSKQGYWEPPVDGEDILLAANESMLILSKATFAQLKQTGKTEFDGQLFNSKSANNGLVEYELNGRKLHAIRADSEDGKTKLWILDDANFPLILKLEGNPFDVDLEIGSIR